MLEPYLLPPHFSSPWISFLQCKALFAVSLLPCNRSKSNWGCKSFWNLQNWSKLTFPLLKFIFMIFCYSTEKLTNTGSILWCVLPEDHRQTIGLLNIPFLYSYIMNMLPCMAKSSKAADIIQVTNQSNCPGKKKCRPMG